VVSERVPMEYLTILRSTDISYVVSGEDAVDLGAVNLLEHFGIRCSKASRK
jgi:hypothetical protein